MALDKLMLYGAASTAFAAAVISNALSSRQNFYAAAVQVGRSSGAIMVGRRKLGMGWGLRTDT